jgi:hypothetical protein
MWITDVESNSSSEELAYSNEQFVPSDVVKQASLFPSARAPLAADDSERAAAAIAPVEVSVAQAFFDNESLNVKVHLKTLTEMDPSNIVVGVSGLKEGTLVEESFQRVSEVVQETTLEEQSVVALRFKLSSEHLSEYQVKCNWGEGVIIPPSVVLSNIDESGAEDVLEIAEATEAIQEDAFIEAPESGSTRASLSRDFELPENEEFSVDSVDSEDIDQEMVEIEPLQDESEPLPAEDLYIAELDVENETILCNEPPCDIMYTVLAQLENRGAQTVDNVQIAVGLYWANSGQLPKVPNANSSLQDNEELIELDGLNIAAGSRATVRVKLDRSVPDVPGGSFIPHVRLLK